MGSKATVSAVSVDAEETPTSAAHGLVFHHFKETGDFGPSSADLGSGGSINFALQACRGMAAISPV